MSKIITYEMITSLGNTEETFNSIVKNRSGSVKKNNMDTIYTEQNIRDKEYSSLTPFEKSRKITQNVIRKIIYNVGGEKFFMNKKVAIVGSSLSNTIEVDNEISERNTAHFFEDVMTDLGIKVLSFSTSNACAASLSAIELADILIMDNDFDYVFAGGVDVQNIVTTLGFLSLEAISEKNAEPYNNSNGVNIGEGCGFLLLGKEIYNTFMEDDIYYHECSSTSDAYHPTTPNLKGTGAFKAMQRTIEKAGIKPDFINGHGTGTVANDQSEQLAVKKLDISVPLISNKGNIGHCMGAAGVVETILSIMMIEKEILLGTYNTNKDSELIYEGVLNESISKKSNTFLTNSFAFGGNNFSMLLSKLKPKEKVDSSKLLFIEKKFSYSFDVMKEELINMDKEKVDIHFKKMINPKILRKADLISQFGMLIYKLEQITGIEKDRIGLFYSTSTGPVTTIEKLNQQALTGQINPSDFPNSVINGVPGFISLNSKITGPTYTSLSGNLGLYQSIMFAKRNFKNQDIDAAFVVHIDEIATEDTHKINASGLVITNQVNGTNQEELGYIEISITDNEDKLNLIENEEVHKLINQKKKYKNRQKSYELQLKNENIL